MTGKRRRGRDPVPPPTPATSPETPTPAAWTPLPEAPVTRPTPTRRQARHERRRQQRRRIGLAGGAVILVVALIVIGGVVFGVHRAVTHNPHHPTVQTQSTVLLQVRAPDGTAQASALLGFGPTGRQPIEILVPSQVTTEVCGYNQLEFGAVLALPNGETASRQALSTILGNATIDGSWVLTPAQLTALIDALGGVTVDVNTNVIRRTAGGGGKILISAGPNQKLSGREALEYAMYAATGADALNQLARLGQVLDATARALPATPSAIAAQLRAVGLSSTSTLGATRLSALLAGFAAADRRSGLYATDLPVTSVDAGGGGPSYRVDAAGTKSLVTGHLAASVRPGAAAGPSVELLNGVGMPGLVATACPKLASAGFVYAGSDNAGSFNNRHSTVVVPTADLGVGYQVAAALGLPRSDVRRTTEDQTVAEVVVTLGADYKP